MKYILYGEKELNHLMLQDEKLKKYIKKYGFIKRKLDTNLFKSLVSSIISQQISTVAATTVFNKLLDLVKDLTPFNILSLKDDEIQSCGISFRKVGYIKGISEAFVSGFINYDKLKLLSDEEIIKHLTKLKGVGIWTAEMLLIHTFNRMNVISFNDLAIKRGLMIVHSLDDLTKGDIIYFKDLYSPYGTIASIYFWEVYRRSKDY